MDEYVDKTNAFVHVANILALISASSGRTEKLYLLHKNANKLGFKEILNFIYNPYKHTGISKAKLNAASAIAKEMLQTLEVIHVVTYADVIAYFNEHNTGSSADINFAATFLASVCKYPEANRSTVRLAKALITHDLQIGITATSLNTVYGRTFIAKTGCMLGTLYKDVPHIHWPCIITEKYDGNRRIILKENGKVSIYTRSGHKDNGLVDIVNEAKLLPNNFMYDCELLAEGTFSDSIQQRQATASIALSNGDRTGVYVRVFDMVPIQEYYAGTSTHDAKYRKTRLAATFADEGLRFLCPETYINLIIAYQMDELPQHIRVAPILGVAHSFGDVQPIVDEIWSRHYEGVMLNTFDGVYEVSAPRRVKSLIKVKNTEEYRLMCTGFDEGEGRNEGRLGALLTTYKGNTLCVGGGFTDAQRDFIWAHQKEYLNKLFEVDCFGESTNAMGGKSLNCPIFKRWAGELD